MFRIFFLIFPVIVKTLALESQFVDPILLDKDDRKFPDGFLFGTSTAAYQIEGAWNTSGKGPSIWDRFTHEHPELIEDGSNADVGPDSYNFYEEDIKAVKSLGMNFYRFSISWARVLPDGDIANVNEAGIAYYDKLIDKILEYDIEPVATMYHYDLPHELQKFGGLANSIFISYFESYANLLFKRFGDRVKTWITFNEPTVFCLKGFGLATAPPMVAASGVGEYLCADNVIKAHAVAYHLYKRKYADEYKGKVGITLTSWYYYSDTNNTEDINRAMDFELGWFANPIFGREGNYPAVMIDQIARHSLSEGRDRSRLPVLTTKWIKFIRGAADFMGLNYYTSRYVKPVTEPYNNRPSYHGDTRLKFSTKPYWPKGNSIWMYSVPSGIRDILGWIRDEYNNPEVLITENGWSDEGEMNDLGRIRYFRDHLNQLLDHVLYDENNLIGYTAWSIIDNFEWRAGFTQKFGMFSVNLASPLKERSPKASSKFMKKVVTSRRIPA